MQDISNERWQQAQQREAEIDDAPDYSIGWYHFKTAYSILFSHIGIPESFNLNNRSILEIGCSHYPAVSYCNNYSKSYVIEPLLSIHLQRIAHDKGIVHIQAPAEKVDFPKVDEVWLFNVLMHVINPQTIIDKAKESANTIRFFEPCDTDKDTAHPHSLSREFYEKTFGSCTKYYPKNPSVINFHTHCCCYGVWKKDENK